MLSWAPGFDGAASQWSIAWGYHLHRFLRFVRCDDRLRWRQMPSHAHREGWAVTAKVTWGRVLSWRGALCFLSGILSLPRAYAAFTMRASGVIAVGASLLFRSMARFSRL